MAQLLIINGVEYIVPNGVLEYVNELKESTGDKCGSCKHNMEAGDMYPCSECCHCKESMWEKK